MELENVLHSEIPLTLAMELSVNEVSENTVRLTASLEKNINHKCTAFGGSLYSVCVLTGWSLLYARLHSMDVHAHIVIHESEIRYLLPVTTDIKSKCTIDNEQHFNRAMNLFHKKGKARFELISTIFQNGDLAVWFQGKYVIHR